ncbi:methylmalonyl Co-A mutase-associated GTPase MeaB [bacterium]|nr:methylmalonyl Co-A mutase-associated GTPase MeaB [bacterium]
MDYVSRVKAGDRRAAARLISLIENQAPEAEQALAELYPSTGNAFLVGITGPPGAGKSSLTDLLIAAIRQDGLKVGVVAVDPSSPFSGGAILGDRIRMKSHAGDPGVFIRSMSSRGQLGGIALATKAATEVLDAYGCDVVIVETVGVGQSEVAIAQATDSTVLVLPPNLGDGIQAIKAGIMEVPDLFVVNKADIPGAGKAAAEILGMLEMQVSTGWNPSVVQTKSLTELDESGVLDLWEHLKTHRDYLKRTGSLAEKRAHQAREEAEALAMAQIERALQGALGTPALVEAIAAVQERREPPSFAARRLLEALKRTLP